MSAKYPVPQQPVTDGLIGELIKACNKASRRRDVSWPGLPITQWPMASKAALDVARANGVVTLVERPSVTRPNSTTTFIVVI